MPSADSTKPDEPASRVLQNRYRLDTILGRGGMGAVYRGVDLLMERPVAVKLIAPDQDLDEASAQRFLREVRTTAKVQHQHIIEVYDLGQTERGELFFVMELLEGESLARRLKRENSMSPAWAVPIVAQICQALDVAHAAGIVHRDLKPANVMLISRTNNVSFVKLIDFGISKSTSSEGPATLTKAGMLIGTLGYMAPEQLSGRPVDGRTDIYSIGVLLYRMLTGTPVFADKGPVVAMYDHINVAPEPMRRRVPDAEISPLLDTIVLRCLAKSPDDRYQSVRDLEVALLRAMAPEATTTPAEIDAETRRIGAASLNPAPGVGGMALIDQIMPDEAMTTTGLAPTPGPVPFELAERAPSSKTPNVQHTTRICDRCKRENLRFARVCVSCAAVLSQGAQEPVDTAPPPPPPLFTPMAAISIPEETAPWDRPLIIVTSSIAGIALICTIAVGWALGMGVIMIGAAGVAVWSRFRQDG
jgi:serine/threonine-protein kinase